LQKNFVHSILSMVRKGHVHLSKINHNYSYVQKFNFYVTENRPCAVQGKINVYCEDNT